MLKESGAAYTRIHEVHYIICNTKFFWGISPQSLSILSPFSRSIVLVIARRPSIWVMQRCIICTASRCHHVCTKMPMYTATVCLLLDDTLQLFENSDSSDDEMVFGFFIMWLQWINDKKNLYNTVFHVKYGGASYTRIKTIKKIDFVHGVVTSTYYFFPILMQPLSQIIVVASFIECLH